MNDNYDDLYKSTHLCYKVILAGDAFVGKTNLVYKFIKNGNENTKNIAPTVGVEFSSKMVRLNDGKRIKAQIWDTGSSTITQLDRNNIDPQLLRIFCMICRHYRRALGALVVYDITKDRTFQNVKKWIEGIKEHASPNVVIVIVGNKSDLKNQQVVTTAEGKRLAKELGVYFEETSALTNDNVEHTFMLMFEEIQKRKKQENAPQEVRGFQLNNSQEPTQNEKCEC